MGRSYALRSGQSLRGGKPGQLEGVQVRPSVPIGYSGPEDNYSFAEIFPSLVISPVSRL
jgi:hypothetical protein